MIRRALEPNHYPFFDYRRFTFSLGIAATGRVWLSGSTAVRFDPAAQEMVVTGGLADQAAVIFDKMRAVLAADGLALSDLVRLTRYIRHDSMDALHELEPLHRSLGLAAEIVTVPVLRLLRDKALIEIEGVALAGKTRDADTDAVALSAAGDPASRDVVSQCEGCYAALADGLGAQGLTLDDLVKTTEFITADALPDYRKTADIRRRLFAPPYPAATGVVMEHLATPGSRIAIQAIALRAA